MKKPILIWLTVVFGGASLIYYLSPNEPIPPTPQPVQRGANVRKVPPPVPPSMPTGITPGLSASSPPPALKPTIAPGANSKGLTATAQMTAAPAAAFASYGELRKALGERKPKVKSLTFVEGTLQVIAVNADSVAGTIMAPTPAALDELRVLAEKRDIKLSAQAKTEEKGNVLMQVLFTFGPTLLIIFILIALIRGARKPPGKKAPPNRAVEKKKWTDVAGQDGAIKMLKRMLYFDKYGSVYVGFKAKRPKGALMVGPPGVGKTLLVQAMAGEGDYDVDVRAGSDFIEMFVGVGASRVRELFEEKKAKFKQTGKLQLLFIDEIDAIAGVRSGQATSGHNEREQTLNALLVEMDGTDKNDGLIVIGATNRVDMLDPAVTRPGRFDYQIHLGLPDLEGREAILKVHTRGMPVAPDVDFKVLARKFTGASGAYLAAVANEAAIIAAERQITLIEKAGLIDGKPAPVENQFITRQDFEAARASIEFGDARLSLQKGMSEEDKHNTSVHEVGHAWMAEHFPWGVSVSVVDIVPRAQYLGVTIFTNDGEKVSSDRLEVVNRIKTLMGGRAAQEVVTGKIDSGAQNDFQQATLVARKMVAEWGMSELGFLGLPETASSIGRSRGQAVTSVGPKLQDLIDDAWRKIVNDAYAETKAEMQLNRANIEAISAVVDEKETILGEEWKVLVAQNPRVPVPDTADGATSTNVGSSAPVVSTAETPAT